MDPLQITVFSMGGVIIDLDGSFFIQLAIVLLVMAVLRQLVFKPYLDSIEARDAKTLRTREEADAVKARAVALAERYETTLADARQKATDARQKLRAEGTSRRDEVIGEAKRVSNAKMDAARAAIDAQYEGVREDLKGRVDELSGLIADKVLGQQGGAR